MELCNNSNNIHLTNDYKYAGKKDAAANKLNYVHIVES